MDCYNYYFCSWEIGFTICASLSFTHIQTQPQQCIFRRRRQLRLRRCRNLWWQRWNLCKILHAPPLISLGRLFFFFFLIHKVDILYMKNYKKKYHSLFIIFLFYCKCCVIWPLKIVHKQNSLMTSSNIFTLDFDFNLP